jgi:hypothetical protein
VQGALLVLPILAVLGYGLVLWIPIFAVLRIVKIAENCADYSITNTARQALYLPLPTDAKYEGKIATDTFLWRCGDLLQAGIVFAGSHWLGFGVQQFALVNMALGLVWLGVAIALARRYSVCTGTREQTRITRSIGRRFDAILAGIPRVRRGAFARGVATLFLVAAGVSVLTSSAPARAELRRSFPTSAPEHVARRAQAAAGCLPRQQRSRH